MTSNATPGTLGGGLLSPDGLWVWDGRRWWPAVSPDGQWRWDGSQWLSVQTHGWRPGWPRRQRGRGTKLFIAAAAAGAALLAVCTLGLGVWFVDAVNGPVDCGGYVVNRSLLLGASHQSAGAMDVRSPVDFTYGGSRDPRNFAVELSAGQLRDLGLGWLDQGSTAGKRLYLTVSYGVDGSAHDPFLGLDFVHGEDYELIQVFDAFGRQMVSDPWLLGPGCVHNA